MATSLAARPERRWSGERGNMVDWDTLAIMRWYVAAWVSLLGIALAIAVANAESPTAALQPTEVVAQIPITPDTPFPLRWGGGSLHHLKARLATLGCIADLIWAYDETRAQWRPYSQYRAPASLNQPFLDRFRDHLPAGDLYASCFDPCDFRYLDDPPDASIRCGAHPTDLSRLERADWSGGVSFGFGEPCTDDWHPTVAERVLPDLPRHPAACIIRTPYCPSPISGIAADEFATYFYRLSRWRWTERDYPVNTPGIVICQAPDDAAAPVNPDAALYVELHEACHLAQSWSVLAWLSPDRPLNPSADPHRNHFEASPAGIEFERIAGFRLSLSRWFFRTTADWLLPARSPWLGVYNDSPVELAAELCAEHLARRLGLDSAYSSQPGILTPEITAWLDRWLLLPELQSPAAGA